MYPIIGDDLADEKVEGWVSRYEQTINEDFLFVFPLTTIRVHNQISIE